MKQNKTKVQIFFHVCAMVFKMLRTMHLFIALYSCHWLNQKLGKKEINNQVKRFPEIHLFNNLQSSRLLFGLVGIFSRSSTFQSMVNGTLGLFGQSVKRLVDLKRHL